MERTAHRDERLALERVLLPDMEVLRDFLQLLARLLDKELEQFRIGRLRERNTRRLAQNRQLLVRAGRQMRRSREILGRAAEVHGLGKCGRRYRWDGRHGRRRLGLERLQGALRVIEHVPRIAAAGLQGLHVVLETHDRISQPIKRACAQNPAARLHHALQLHADRLENLHRARAAEHQ